MKAGRPHRTKTRRPEKTSPAKPKPPRLSWPVHRDVARIFAAWSQRFRALGSEAFAFLLILEALRVTGPKPERFHYGELARALGISTNTLRRWLRTLKRAGLVTTLFVPGTYNAQAYFQIHLDPGGLSAKQQRARIKVVAQN